jgi:hypothetical protein
VAAHRGNGEADALRDLVGRRAAALVDDRLDDAVPVLVGLALVGGGRAGICRRRRGRRRGRALGGLSGPAAGGIIADAADSGAHLAERAADADQADVRAGAAPDRLADRCLQVGG